MTMREGETVTTQETAEDRTFVGYGPAAEYLGLRRNTLSSYVARGIGPLIDHREVEGQYNLPVFTEAELKRWQAERPGQGARTDLVGAAV
jgi:hypothetical protein